MELTGGYSEDLVNLTVLLMGILLLTAVGTGVYALKLATAANRAPQLLRLETPTIAALDLTDRISVIIPAYNEAANIRDCICAVLDSDAGVAQHLDLWVVDDQSTDETLAIAQTLQTELADPRLHIVAGQPRPTGEIWMGKNWACVQAAAQCQGDFLLFLDADVRLKPGAIATAVHAMNTAQIDLLTLWPSILCGCLAEWLAQPLIVGSLAASLDFADVNNPNTETVFAVGPFMLFRRSAYEHLGGHRAVATQVVEDIELARRIKQAGLKLHYTLGHDLATLRMYQTNAALWEGWTKNWYLGSQRNLSITLYGAIMVLWICATPLLGLVYFLATGAIAGFTPLTIGGLALSFTTILLQFRLRSAIARLSTIPPRYWWLTGIGGLFLSAIMIASIIKTETGWGWTWRGRALAKPTEP